VPHEDVTLATHSTRSGRTRSTRNSRTRAEPQVVDLNLAAAALLYDMAFLQPTERSQFGYKRAAKAIIALPVLVSELVAAKELRDVPFVGPASARIVTELVESGRSATVETAIAQSGKQALVEAHRALRHGFLSSYTMRQILDAKLPVSIVDRARFRGDFQMHSTGSDGTETVAGMADACMALGHTCLGITDHSYGLPIARGMSMSAVARQHEEIDQLNAQYGGRFRIFKGIEANILADGQLDLGLDERQRFEFVVASPHSLLRREQDQTSRMLTAIGARGVAVLGHPRGRIFNSRGGVVADWPRIFDKAAERGVAVEIDGNWHRQDLDWELASEALAAGCLFALDSDAHSIGELQFTDYSIAHARVARIPADRVINCWPDDRLDEWMRERREG
jgi:histidinol phosphatase-like PHP family hydrolase